MLRKLVAGAAVAVGLAAVPTVASAAPTSGTVHLYSPGTESATNPVVVVGAIGDYGKAVTYNAKGKPDSNGMAYVILTLKNGTVRGSLHQLAALEQKFQPTFSQTTCSGEGSITGPVVLSDGTGAYKGITGTLQITETFAFVAPKTSAGKCSDKDVPAGDFGVITGVGTVTIPG